MPADINYKILYQSLRNTLALLSSVVSMISIFVILLLGPDVTRAATIEGLYSQEVLASGQSSQERAEAMKRALSTVLVKVAGHRSVLQNDLVINALNAPEKYVRKYRFRTDDTSSERKQYFQAVFDESELNQLLRTAGIAIWGNSRPSTLIWLAVENNGQRSIINASGSLTNVFFDSFQDRGLPLLFPLMDFEDATAITTVDVWGGFTRKLQEASKRYGSESILTGRLSQHDDFFYGRFSLIFRGVSQSVVVNGLNAVDMTQLAADLAGEILYQHYAIDASKGNGNTVLKVTNIKSLEDYAALKKYLEKIAAVRTVSVSRVTHHTVELELFIEGSESQLADSLALGRNLQAISQPSSGFGNSSATENTFSTLVYRWSK